MDPYENMTTEDLQALFAEKTTALSALVALDAPTVAQVEEASSIDAERDAVQAEMTKREEMATAAAEKFAGLRQKFADKEEKVTKPVSVDSDMPEAQVPDADTQIDPNAPDEVEGDPEDEVKRLDQEAKDNTGGSAPQSTARSQGVVTLARKVKRPAAPARDRSAISLTAAADVPGFATSSTITGLEQLGEAIVAKTQGFAQPPQGDGTYEDIRKFPVASIRREFPKELTIDRGSDDMEVLSYAAKESRLPGGSLVAAGGWCAPSETMYDLCSEGESLEGLISIPEVNVARGGINYTRGPDFSTFYGTADGFWVQTEAQAIAGATKPCVTVACPAFTEVRMDAVGLCIKIPILTNATWPELIQRYVSGFLTAYQHRLSANVLTRMLALSPAARAITGMGSTVTDTLNALTLIADQRREKYRMAMNTSLEVILPFWVKNAMLADLGARSSSTGPATEAELNAYFSARNFNVQWVYNWQPLPVTDNPAGGVNEANIYPTTFNALMYPAGTFIKGTKDVINLNTIYDAASLAVNVYTGLFMEEGLLVAKMCNDADLLTIPVCNAGRTGAANFTCP